MRVFDLSERGSTSSVNTVGQQLLNGLTLGSTYALMALGIAMVFSILHLANFAHGELLTICGYTMLGLRMRARPGSSG